MPSCLQGGELGEQRRRRAKIRERKGRKEGEKKKKKKKGVRFVSFCRVELDGRACTHCGKHPMVVAYLFARTISLDNAEEVKEKLEVMRAWSVRALQLDTIFYEPLIHFL